MKIVITGVPSTYIAIFVLLVAYETLPCSSEAHYRGDNQPSLSVLFPRKRQIPTQNCCLVNTCHEIPIETQDHDAFQCYNKELCGEICIKGNNKRAPPPYAPYTPGYNIKQYVLKSTCRGSQCRIEYTFSCDRCPDPNTPAFSIYAIKSDCIDCYYL